MKKIEPADIRAIEDYEIDRARIRERMLEIKGVRRIAIGNALTLLFENRDTMIYQIQEMLRVEKITDLKAIKHEIETYNELVPDAGELTATLLIEYDDPEERDRRLRELLGLENHLWLEVSGYDRIAGQFDLRQMSDQRISSVHYLRFGVGGDVAGAIRSGIPVSVAVDHPQLQATARLGPEQAAALAEDLSA